MRTRISSRLNNPDRTQRGGIVIRRSAQQPYLLIPGPTVVDPQIAAAGARAMIGHRGAEVQALVCDLLSRLRALLGTESDVYPLACSATGAMEAAIRNAGPGPILHLVCGAFSQRWSEIRESCGVEGDEVAVQWGRAIDPQAVQCALERRDYVAVTLVHSETSTGVLNPLPEIAAVVREFEDTLLLVDTVSSMVAVPLELDTWGVDVCLAGVQKAWALPAGLTVCAVSPRALKRSASADRKGFYFDWCKHHSALEKGQTPSTPPLSLMFQLQAQLDRIEEEGMSARHRRHLALQSRVAKWAEGRFDIYSEEGHRTPTLTPLLVGDVDVSALLAAMRERGWILGAGYGRTRDELIRIGHMGEMTLDVLEEALADLDTSLGELSSRAEGK
jgi:aspartate aminotransferase-like enzyme